MLFQDSIRTLAAVHSEEFFNGPGIPIIFFVLIALGFGCYFWYEKKRREELERVARSRGFRFQAKVDPRFAQTLRISSLPLFQRGRSRHAGNVLQGQYHGISWKVFDYRYTVGHGKNSHPYRYSVAYAEQERRSFPRFSLSPEYFFHRIGEVFGLQDIDFDSNPIFSKRYRLVGSDVAAIRARFNPYVLATLEQTKKPITLEACERQFIDIVPNRIKPQKLWAFLDEATHMFHNLAG